MLRDVNLTLDFSHVGTLKWCGQIYTFPEIIQFKFLIKKYFLNFLAFLLRANQFKYCAFLETPLVQTTLSSEIIVI